jgi:sugar phosphate isomerase/epimerase
VHPRLSVSQVSSWHWSIDDDLAFYDETGIDTIGVSFHKLASTGDPVGAAERLNGTGLHITDLVATSPFTLGDPARWSDERDAAGVIMDATLALQPEHLVLTTGPAGTLTWERAADALEETLTPLVREAARAGLRIAVEHTNPLRVDVSFLHTLRDAVEIGWRLGTGVCMEVNACWAERNLQGTIAAGIDLIDVVQVSDFAVGTHRSPDRLVPGDGDIPLRRIIGNLLDAGYAGVFSVEIVGPRIEEEGYASAITRSLQSVGDLVDEIVDGAS